MASRADRDSSNRLTIARAHLRQVDPVIARLIEAQPDFNARAWLEQMPEMDDFAVLLLQITAQQLSVTATRRILSRITDLFGGRLPLPDDVVSVSSDELRQTGLSRRKVDTMRMLVSEFVRQRLSYARPRATSDVESKSRFTAISRTGP